MTVFTDEHFRRRLLDHAALKSAALFITKIFSNITYRWAISISHANIGPNGEALRGRKDLQHEGTAAQNQALQRVLDEARDRGK